MRFCGYGWAIYSIPVVQHIYNTSRHRSLIGAYTVQLNHIDKMGQYDDMPDMYLIVSQCKSNNVAEICENLGKHMIKLLQPRLPTWKH